MIAIIQCAGSKQPGAASLCLHGERLSFVASPEAGEKYQVRPWDKIPGMNATWIDCVGAINGLSDGCHWDDFTAAGVTCEQGYTRMYKAGQLYQPPEYQGLVEAIGEHNVYILSAGWGLVNAVRQLPDYDITFSDTARKTNKYITPKRRSTEPSLERNIEGEGLVHLFITPKYLDYWSRTLARPLESHDIILHWHRSDNFRYRVEVHDCGGRRTNWHYTAVDQFIRNTVG